MPLFQAARNRSCDPWQDPREVPLYDVTEAARFVGVPQAALVEWMRPVTNAAGSSLPLLQLLDPSSGRLSFANLAEAHILEAIRNHDVVASELRAAIDVVRRGHYGTNYPLLTTEFYKRGKSHFVECLCSLMAANRRSLRLAASLAADLERYLERIQRDENDDPYQLFPMRLNKNKYVALNINVVAGHPIITGTGLLVQHLDDLVRAGMSISSVASRYKLNEGVLIDALAFLPA